jgi:hypothetical protein
LFELILDGIAQRNDGIIDPESPKQCKTNIVDGFRGIPKIAPINPAVIIRRNSWVLRIQPPFEDGT